MHIHMMCIMHVDERRREIIFIDFAKNVEKRRSRKKSCLRIVKRDYLHVHGNEIK